MQIELNYVFGLLALIATVVSLYNALKKENKTDGVTQGRLSNDLEYVKRGVDNMLLEQKDAAREQIKQKEMIISTQNDVTRALENAERAYNHANEAHSRINKLNSNQK